MPVLEPKIKPCFLRTPGPVQTAMLPWGRRKWAQPSRIRRPRRAGRRVGVTGGYGIGKVRSLEGIGGRGLRAHWGPQEYPAGLPFRPPSENGKSMVS